MLTLRKANDAALEKPENLGLCVLLSAFAVNILLELQGSYQTV
jgi:hypothetical protein